MSDNRPRGFAALTSPKAGIVGAAALLAFAGAVAVGTAPKRASDATASATSVLIAPANAAEASPKAGDAVSSFSDAQRADIEKIVRAYLLAHPEILVEVSQELEKRQAEAQAASHQQVIVDNKAKLYASEFDYVYGNPKGDVGVIEFFDYNCAWCKRALDQVQQLTQADPNVRVVMKELPIFGEASITAAKAAMAAKRQGKYWELHVALMQEKRVTDENVFTIAQSVGIDVAKLKADMADPKLDEALRETSQLAEALGIQGTPGFIVDTKVNVGYVPVAGLKTLVGDVRKEGCRAC